MLFCVRPHLVFSWWRWQTSRRSLKFEIPSNKQSENNHDHCNLTQFTNLLSLNFNPWITNFHSISTKNKRFDSGRSTLELDASYLWLNLHFMKACATHNIILFWPSHHQPKPRIHEIILKYTIRWTEHQQVAHNSHHHHQC